MTRTPERPSERVTADLRHRIEAGEWASGQQLPAVSAMARHYQVSTATVARAYRRLAAEGLLTIVARWGVFRA